MASEEIDLKGRYLKVIDDSNISHYPCVKGDYILFNRSSSAGYEYWGEMHTRSNYHGILAHKSRMFELMPVGFKPDAVLVKPSLYGRYLKVIKDGYFRSHIPIGSYLKILEDDPKDSSCMKVEQYGILSRRIVEREEFCVLMPEGFVNPGDFKYPKTVIAMVDEPYGGDVKKGEIGVQTSIKYLYDFPSQKSYNLRKEDFSRGRVKEYVAEELSTAKELFVFPETIIALRDYPAGGRVKKGSIGRKKKDGLYNFPEQVDYVLRRDHFTDGKVEGYYKQETTLDVKTEEVHYVTCIKGGLFSGKVSKGGVYEIRTLFGKRLTFKHCSDSFDNIDLDNPCPSNATNFVRATKWEYDRYQKSIAPNKEFIIGEWYKGLIGARTYYIKVLEILPKGYLKGDTINAGKYIGNANWSNEDLIKEALAIGPVDISEVQEFLPDGHKDKLPAKHFIVGSWYKGINCGLDYYVKVTKPFDGKTLIGENIVDGKYESSSCWNNLELIGNAYRRGPISTVDIQSFLPPGHPDKTVVEALEDKLIKGKWYKAKSAIPGKWFYLKYLENNKGTLKGEGIGSTGTYLSYHSWSGDLVVKEAVENGPVDVKEIQQWLPDGHMDKFIVPKEKSFPAMWYLDLKDSDVVRQKVIDYRGTKKIERPEDIKITYEYMAHNGYCYYNTPPMHCERITFKEFMDNVYANLKPAVNMDEILEEAKRRYPVGSYAYSAYDPKIQYKMEIIGCAIGKETIVNRSPSTGVTNGTIYMEGRWAEPIEKIDLSYSMGVDTYEDPLIVEARRRYPIGTVFFPAHLANTGSKCVVVNTQFELISDRIFALTDSGNTYSREKGRYGDNSYSRCVYSEGKWATTATDESLIERARREYPVGTSYQSSSGNVFTVEEKDVIRYWGKNEDAIDIAYKGFLYANERWAKIVSKKSIDLLPKNWCIKVTGGYTKNPEVYKWRSHTRGLFPWKLDGYMSHDKIWTAVKNEHNTEIPFDIFMRCVYNPLFESIPDSSKQPNISQIDSYKGLTFLPDVDDRFII